MNWINASSIYHVASPDIWQWSKLIIIGDLLAPQNIGAALSWQLYAITGIIFYNIIRRKSSIAEIREKLSGLLPLSKHRKPKHTSRGTGSSSRGEGSME